MDGLIEVRLLGPALVRTATGEQVRQWKTAKNRDLLRLLAVNHGVVVPAEQVLEALWPAAPQEKGRASLRTAIAQLRRIVGPAAVERVGDGLRLGPAWVDLAVYESRVAAAHRLLASGDTLAGLVAAKEAVALRPGPLLADDPFAEWLGPVRSHVERRHAKLLADAAEAALAAGLVHGALELGSLALRHDACAERAGRVVMAACARQGDTAAALRVFAGLRDALVEELGADPAPETSALHLEILTATAAPAPPGAGVGADAAGAAASTELEQLVRAIRGSLQERRGHVAVVLGPDAGAVSALLRAASDALAATGPVHHLPPGGGIDAVPTDAGPAAGVLVVDGVERPRGDELLALAARAVTAPPTVVVLGCPQAATIAGTPAPELVATSPDVTVVPLAGAAAAPGGHALDAEAVLSGRMEQARSALEPDEQEVLDLLAVCGAALPIAALVRLARDVPSAEVAVRALAKLDALGLLRTTAEGHDLAHGVAQLAAAWLRPGRRTALHERIAADTALPAEVRARHLLAAGRAEAAAELFLSAATDATRRGPARRLRRLLWDARHAIAQADLDDAATAAWLRRIADVASSVGRTDDALEALAGAVRLLGVGSGSGTAAVVPPRPRRRGAPQEERPGAEADDGVGGRRAARPGPAAAPQAQPGAGASAEAEVRARLLRHRLWPARDLDGVRVLDEELDAFDPTELDEATLAFVELARVEGALWAGDGAAHLRRLWRLWPALRDHPDDDVAAQSAIVLGWALHELDDARFDEVWEAAERRSRRSGRLRQWEALSAMVAMERGDLPRARDRAAAALGAASGDRSDVPITLLGVARRHQRDGRLHDAASTLGAALVAARRADRLLLVPEMAARLAVLEAPHAPEAAASHLALAEGTAGQGRWFPRERVWILLAQAALHRAAGEHDLAEELALRGEEAAASARLAWERWAVHELAAAAAGGAAPPELARGGRRRRQGELAVAPAAPAVST